MNDLRTLAFTVAGAIGLSLIYAIAFGGQRIDIESDKAEGRSVQHVVSGDRGEFELRDGDYSIAAEWKGDIKLNAAGDGLDALDNWLEIQETAQGVERMLEYRFEDGQIIRRFSAGDAESDDENAAAEMFLRFLRASGLKADERVGALLQSGTPADVVAEIVQAQSDNAARRYIVALAERADLGDSEIIAIADRLARIQSDSELRVSIRSLIEHETLTAASAEAIMTAARTIESDHDVRLLIETFSESGLTETAWPLAIELVRNLESDHDFRRAAEALLGNDSLSAEHAAAIVAAAADQVDSDHDMRLILSLTASRLGDAREFDRAWLRGLSEIDSDHDRRLALTQAAQRSGLPPELVIDLIAAAASIDSDHDKRLALERLASQATSDAAVAAFRKAAGSIDSDDERNRALRAIPAE